MATESIKHVEAGAHGRQPTSAPMPLRNSAPSAAADTTATIGSLPARTKIQPPHILRFRKSERMIHWAIAVPFLVCLATALSLVIFYNPHPQRPWRFVFSWAHRISGACLFVLPLLTALRNRRDYKVHLNNIREACTWARDDVKWLVLMGAAAISSRISLPEQGKFNAAEKLNFMMVLCTYPLFIVTGLVLCAVKIAFLSWIAHVAMAAMATPLVLGHIFMATINPETRVGLSGMLTGYVDRHWAKHHYTRWYRHHFECDRHADHQQRAQRQAPRHAALIRRPAEAK